MQQSHPFGDNITSRRPHRPAPIATAPSSPPPPPPPQASSSREALGIEAVLSSPPKTPVPRSVFSSGRLPRSSSLIPPHGSPPSASTAAVHTPPHHANARQQTHRGPVQTHASLKRPSTPSSQLTRGASAGASPQEASRTRNRWSTLSIGSVSSPTSPYASRQASLSNSRIRRASLEAALSPPSVPPPLPPVQAPPRQPSYMVRSRFDSSNSGAAPASAHLMRTESSMSMRHYENGQFRSISPNPYANTSHTTTSSTARMPHEHSHDPYAPRGHSRDHSGKSSRDLGKHRPSQKAMLSRALQMANTAVQLDNAQNFEGARESYAEACDLLQQVLDRTSGDEDKRKLETIVGLKSLH